MSDAESVKAAIRSSALELGFDDFGVMDPASRPDLPARLQAFLADGFHGSMTWMADRADQRADPAVLWSDVRSVIMLTMNYGPERDPRSLLEEGDKGNISVYARGRDYHDVVKKRLKALARDMVARFGGELKVFVDTAPVMEKPLAEAAGLGWQGKHTNLVSRTSGSWTFLGAIYTTLKLPVDQRHDDRCGSCRACLDACPTDAFPAPYRLDARKCISYLTIEHKGSIPEALRPAFGNRIYGCDDCLAACPWNKFAHAASEAKLHAKEELEAPALKDLLKLDDTAFRALFSGSPIKRIGRNRFVRNCLVAAGNSADPSLLSRVNALLDDEDAVVRDAADWAQARLNALL